MHRYAFRWIDWNIEKVEKHGVRPEEAEFVVCNPCRPYPLLVGDEKRLEWGATATGRSLQVIYLLDADDCVFVIHARPLTDNEKRRYRRRRR